MASQHAGVERRHLMANARHTRTREMNSRLWKRPKQSSVTRFEQIKTVYALRLGRLSNTAPALVDIQFLRAGLVDADFQPFSEPFPQIA